MIDVADLSVRLAGVPVVRNVSFATARGGAVALWGENGAGKTTVLRALLGHVQATGRLDVDGTDPRRDPRAARAKMGYVPQQVALYEDLTCLGLLRFAAGLRNVDPGQAPGLLSRVGLGLEALKPVGHLSGGMRQRLALAVALLGEPAILILDEPTANLDAAGRGAFLELLADLRAAGMTMVVTTHRHEEVAALADTVVVLERGRCIETTSASDWIRRTMALSRLHIALDPGMVPAAINTLDRFGIVASPNGHGIFLDIRPSERAGPIGILARAGIKVAAVEVAAEEDGS